VLGAPWFYEVVFSSEIGWYCNFVAYSAHGSPPCNSLFILSNIGAISNKVEAVSELKSARSFSFHQPTCNQLCVHHEHFRQLLKIRQRRSWSGLLLNNLNAISVHLHQAYVQQTSSSILAVHGKRCHATRVKGWEAQHLCDCNILSFNLGLRVFPALFNYHCYYYLMWSISALFVDPRKSIRYEHHDLNSVWEMNSSQWQWNFPWALRIKHLSLETLDPLPICPPTPLSLKFDSTTLQYVWLSLQILWKSLPAVWRAPFWMPSRIQVSLSWKKCRYVTTESATTMNLNQHDRLWDKIRVNVLNWWSKLMSCWTQF
jgi:hypothetical protein